MTTNEYDEVEALKKWWKESGVSTFVSIGLAIALFFGWQGWQKNQQQTLENSAVEYEEFIQAVAKVENQPDDIAIATAMNLAVVLKEDYRDSGFAYFAALFKAKQYVKDADLESAKAELEWLLAQKPERELKLLTELRLARILNELNETQAAMQLLDQQALGAFESSFLEVKGDILLAQGNYSEAAAAYTQSRKANEKLELAPSATLDFKLDYAQSFLQKQES